MYMNIQAQTKLGVYGGIYWKRYYITYRNTLYIYSTRQPNKLIQKKRIEECLLIKVNILSVPIYPLHFFVNR